MLDSILHICLIKRLPASVMSDLFLKTKICLFKPSSVEHCTAKKRLTVFASLETHLAKAHS